MKKIFVILFLFAISGFLSAQDWIVKDSVVVTSDLDIPTEQQLFLTDTVAVPNDTIMTREEYEAIPDTILRNMDHMYKPVESIFADSLSRTYWRITERTGEIIAGNPDTTLTNFFYRQLVESHSVSMSYLGNLGLPAESRIFFDRPQRSNFMFMDNFSIYTKAPGKNNFMNTKIPYSNINYITSGSQQWKEERFTADLSINFGKKLNIGGEVDYLYSRGYYNSQAAKHLDWVLYGSYIADRHRVHAFINNADYTNAENGGIRSDLYITDPQSLSARNIKSKDIPTWLNNTWNHMEGNRYYVNYRYNLGFERDTELVDSSGYAIKEFIPVSSLIYTFDFDDKSRNFISRDTAVMDTLNHYKNNKFLTGPLNDSTSYWNMKNTVGISLREGFAPWAKFDITAFITHQVSRYTLMTKDTLTRLEKTHSTTYIGGEIAKRRGKIFRYNAQGSLGLWGYYIGDFDLSGNIQTRIPVFGDTAAVTGSAHIKNTSPTFYENTFRSRYLWWDRDFKKTQRVYFGGALTIPHTKTILKLGVENITDYIYFDNTGYPQQHSGNIQIMAATLTQNFRYGILNWQNDLVYQTSSNQDIIPLPDLSIYTNLFIEFKVAKVLTIQMGANANYFTEYYAPTYEPVTQQFKLQDYSATDHNKPVKVGNFPLINGYVNCHLKYTRFFIEFYNLGASFIDRAEYFSLPHYPVNPQVFKWGLSWDFNN